MTVEELLMLAEAHLDYANGDIVRDMYAAAISSAAIAQAAATTAQAMMLQMYLCDMDDARTTNNWIQDHA